MPVQKKTCIVCGKNGDVRQMEPYAYMTPSTGRGATLVEGHQVTGQRCSKCVLKKANHPDAHRIIDLSQDRAEVVEVIET